MSFTYPLRWLPEHPEKFQLYMLGTANAVKVSIALEEMALDYDSTDQPNGHKPNDGQKQEPLGHLSIQVANSIA